MAMGTILRVIRDELRRKHNWPNDACKVAYMTEPLDNTPTEYFVGVDESSVDTGPLEGYRLEETYRIHVGIWRKLGQYPHDRREPIFIDEDIHLGNIDLPHHLERQIIKALHWQYEVMECINTALGTPTHENGSGLIEPFRYEGRGRTTVKAMNDGGHVSDAWAGRVLRFGGAKRIQTIDCLG